MNKKGFTLVETVVTISLILLLALIVVPSVVNNDSKTKKSMYDAKIKQALNAAYKYGNDNIDSLSSECLDTTINTLINLKYLSGDDESGFVLVNPINNESMNNTIICIKYIDGEVITDVK